MYQQDYCQPRVPLDGWMAAPPSTQGAVSVVLDDYNSDLNFVIEPNKLVGSSLHDRGFEYMWAGGRATHGVRTGKAAFEVRVLNKLQVSMPETERTPHVMRVGWSTDLSSFQVGEDALSYGYGGTGKCSVNNKFFDYGETYTCNDVITCYIDLDATPKAIFFAKNGQYLNVAFRIGPELNGQALFPHITVKNMRFSVNFGKCQPCFPLTQGFTMLERFPSDMLVRASVSPTSRQDCEVIMMVGLPAAGKTCWAQKYVEDHKEKQYNILGTNAIMDRMKVMGLMRKRNYHGRWDALIKQATDLLNQLFKVAEKKNRNYILDQTNVYPNARRRKMNNFRGYHRISAVITTTNEALKQRAEKREREEGKIVPESAVMEMKANFTLPVVGESFDEVWFIEEDKSRSEHLIREFRQEAQAFKAAEARKAQESERISPSSSTLPSMKRSRSEPAPQTHTAGQSYSLPGAHCPGRGAGGGSYPPPRQPIPVQHDDLPVQQQRPPYSHFPSEHDDRYSHPAQAGCGYNRTWSGGYGGPAPLNRAPPPFAHGPYQAPAAGSASGWCHGLPSQGYDHRLQYPADPSHSYHQMGQPYTTQGHDYQLGYGYGSYSSVPPGEYPQDYHSLQRGRGYRH